MVLVAGERWERLRDAACLVPGLPAGTLRAWVSRGRVRSVRVGGQAWVAVDDVLAADAARTPRRRRAVGR